ncbi:MAG: DUF2264 domain-containing protein [Prevotella sp.]|jgi:hypothetical protein|nr:DUF2264 domain-containing protein [Prevotella sp.]MCI2081177.1 DUF2264 domain-containing protein [Prevotella sp.]MCI2103020.1 DUF2264 domain-containing protein [Prevotella sp.]
MKVKYLMIAIMAFILAGSASAKKVKNTPQTDRQYWAGLCYKIAQPILENMSKGELQKNMPLELSPNWDGRNVKVSYLEAFGRLMAGITPWLALPDDGTPEGKQRKQLHDWALASYKNAVDPQSPDYLLWKGELQILVDAAYLAESFLRAPESTWYQLDKTTQQRYIQCFKGLRVIRPAYNNWLLFRAIIEAFFLSIGEEADMYVLRVACCKINEWYLGDGYYSDGPEMAFDYYNAYVIHPMYIEVLEQCEKHKFWTPVSSKLAIQRMQRYNTVMERLVSPEGTYPGYGRSLVYRMGAFQTLAMAAWRFGMPKNISNGQVRSAITAVMKNMFKVDGNFDDKGFLRLGFVGHQPNLANSYTDNGSLYMTFLVFMPLGLPADAPFWTAPAEPWTSQKAWSGKSFPIDGHVSLKTEK